jgi:UDP-N-acetylglucosamine 2-epimerase
MTLRVVTVVGTRPEVIRLSRTLARLDRAFEHYLVHTGQNYDHELSGLLFEELDLRPPDEFLGVDTSSLGRVLGETLISTEAMLRRIRPDAFLVLGDTNSCLSAVIAKRMQIPVYHMEAGNRCFDDNVPEETNRRLIDHIADFNLPYTEHARRHLLAEGLPSRRIMVTGSPMAEVLEYYRPIIEKATALEELGLMPGGYMLASVHRQENVDDPARLAALVDALVACGRRYERPVVVSTHPRTRSRLERAGIGSETDLRFHRPFGFPAYVSLQQQAFCVLSDSGTISEECSILDFPAVTLRNAIERPEALETGRIVTSGVTAAEVLQAVDHVVGQRRGGASADIPEDYRVRDCSQRVVNIIQSTAPMHHTWAGIRRHPG